MNRARRSANTTVWSSSKNPGFTARRWAKDNRALERLDHDANGALLNGFKQRR
jgi:hypothetical protein